MNGKPSRSASEKSEGAEKFDESRQFKIGGIDREKLMESFSKSVKCGLMYINGEEIVGSVNSCDCSCDIIKRSKKAGEFKGNYCLGVHCYAGEQSGRFGGKYIYFCPAGFVFIICPIDRNGDFSEHGEYKQFLTAGPISPVNWEDFDTEELADALKLDLSGNETLELVKKFPIIPSDLITHVANLLYICSSHLSEIEIFKFIKNDEIYEQQKQIGEYIQNVKAMLIKESQSYISYPYDKEKQLVYSIVSNDLVNSRKYLNEILGHIFFSSANNLDVIKVRAMELSVMISRAALDGGADQSKIFDINIKFLSEFFNYKTIEEVCWALTDILRKFTKETFEFSKVKHVDLISKAVSYVKTNYMRKLTLNEVAEYVFLSPSYFSKIFKEEMNYYFNDYLNYVRVEKSKILLLTEKISLVDIADNVGFYDQSYFNKVFKKITGVTPKKYKESNGKIPPQIKNSYQ
ncbi:MAG: AraC family transcriptional regulator [Oscillospiraceae bacterium]|nr:AraC family transcriptional regulator [Oscillospiraceae bacterium]